MMLAEELRVQDDAFQVTVDPKFCYLDPIRWHACASFLSGAYKGGGLFTLAGQAGIAKTTLLHHLAGQVTALDGFLPLCPMHVPACRTGTTFADVLLGLGEAGATPLKAAKRLRQLAESNHAPVLLLDDADLLDDDVLEALVALTKLQGGDRRLLSIVLAGHPSLPRRVSTINGNDEGLGASRTIELKPLAEPDVARLIRHRLRAAGRPEDAIGPDAIAWIARHSEGVPGVVVRVCQQATQIAESRSRKTVTADIVANAIGEEISGAQRVSSHDLRAPVPRPTVAAEPPRLAALHSMPPRALSLAAESRPVPLPRDGVPSPAPSLIREPHRSIPHVTLGHYSLSGRPGERRNRSYKPAQRLHGRRRRSKLMLVWAGVFLVVLATGLSMLFRNPHEIADRAHTSTVAGHVGNTGALRGYGSPTATPPASAMIPPGRGVPVTASTPLPPPTTDAAEGAMGMTGAAAHLEEELAAYRASLAAISEKLGRAASRGGRTDERE